MQFFCENAFVQSTKYNLADVGENLENISDLLIAQIGRAILIHYSNTSMGDGC